MIFPADRDERNYVTYTDRRVFGTIRIRIFINARASTVHKTVIAQRSGASIACHPVVPEPFSEATGILPQIPAPDGQARSRAAAGVSGLAAGAKRFAGVLIRIGLRICDCRRTAHPARHAATDSHERSHAEGHWPQARGHSPCRALRPGLMVPPTGPLSTGWCVGKKDRVQVVRRACVLF
jgi:hypothetical protein